MQHSPLQKLYRLDQHVLEQFLELQKLARVPPIQIRFLKRSADSHLVRAESGQPLNSYQVRFPLSRLSAGPARHCSEKAPLDMPGSSGLGHSQFTSKHAACVQINSKTPFHSSKIIFTISTGSRKANPEGPLPIAVNLVPYEMKKMMKRMRRPSGLAQNVI
jgi:hypothetical protein